jgi:hypothetical protein
VPLVVVMVMDTIQEVMQPLIQGQVVVVVLGQDISNQAAMVVLAWLSSAI